MIYLAYTQHVESLKCHEGEENVLHIYHQFYCSQETGNHVIESEILSFRKDKTLS